MSGANQISISYAKIPGITLLKSNARKTLTKTLIGNLLTRILFDVLPLFYENLFYCTDI